MTPAPVERNETPPPTLDPTPRPTLRPTPPPTPEPPPTPKPSATPTGYPSPMPLEPTTPLPSKSKTQTFHPTPTELGIMDTYHPTPTELGTMIHPDFPTLSPVQQDGEITSTGASSSQVVRRTSPPSDAPTDPPTSRPSEGPTPAPTISPVEHCADPVDEPVCPFLPEVGCCQPICRWDAAAGNCGFVDNRSMAEVEWAGEFEVGQTHVVRAEGETRHAPRVIAGREAELLFAPASARRLGSPEASRSAQPVRRREKGAQSIESLGTVYLIQGEGETPVLDVGAQRLVDGSGAAFTLSAEVSNIDIVVDLKAPRLIAKVSVTLHGDATSDRAELGLHRDDGRNEEEGEGFVLPDADWSWHDMSSATADHLGGEISADVPWSQARYVMLSLRGGSSPWGFGSVGVRGYVDGLTPTATVQDDSGTTKIMPLTRAVVTDAAARVYAPQNDASVYVTVHGPSGRLIGATKARDPSHQRDILERSLSSEPIDNYSDNIWSVTLPHSWVAEGNVVSVGTVHPRRPGELLVRRWEMRDFARFDAHAITRVKLAVFGSKADVARLDSETHSARRLVRDLHSVMPVKELVWSDTGIWHLPYVVVMGKNGPALVDSEAKRREATGDGEGTELSWSALKNGLTIRHSLAQTGLGLSSTIEEGGNSPYASGTSVFMGWSKSRRQDDAEDVWEWEDFGYWDKLAAAAWTGWCVMKSGDECSNYYVHEIGHAQTMQHFDDGTAAAWGIADEYPEDGELDLYPLPLSQDLVALIHDNFCLHSFCLIPTGRHLPQHPWGYDAASRRFRTWFDPLRGDGKFDPLNGAGEGPTSQQCFSQYTPYQAKKSQEWASMSPILLSASSADVPVDGAYKFDPSTRSYSPLEGADLTDAVGEAASPPHRVGIPVITLIGTIGKDRDVCQTYPVLRSRWGNTFELPDPFSPFLPPAFKGASHFIEIRFEGGDTVRGLIAVGSNLREDALRFFSVNVAIDRRPTAVGLYRFTDESWPHLTPQSEAELLHLRPTDLPPGDSLMGVPPLRRVGRGWVGDSSRVVISRFCETADHCNSEEHTIEWRGEVGSDSIIYKSSLSAEPQTLLGSTVFKVPAKREWDDSEYTVTVLATRSFDGGQGSAPLLVTVPPSADGSSETDATHAVRISVPWEMNGSLPAGTYHSIAGAFMVWAVPFGGSSKGDYLELDVTFNLQTVTEAPTRSPTRKPSPGPSRSPVQVRYFIDWMAFTCVTDGESTEWAPAHVTKEGCCFEHMAYDMSFCMRDAEQ
ncbi:hypothetical protein ACHAWF_016377 [Thalassiosira exigua]